MNRVRYTRRAARDLEEIVDYLVTEAGPVPASAVLEDLLEAAEHIASSPRMGHRRPDLTPEDVRFWVVRSYFVVYRPAGDIVEVIRVLHGARNPNALRRELDPPELPDGGSQPDAP